MIFPTNHMAVAKAQSSSQPIVWLALVNEI